MPYSRLFYHVIWTTKQRIPLINTHNEDAIYRAIREKIVELDGMVYATNGMSDHVHLVVSLSPAVALGKIVGQLKGSSSFVVNRLTGQSETFAWQQDYGILSISESHVPSIVRYVEQQKQHHADGKLDPRLETSHLAV
jgi:putative transposase